MIAAILRSISAATLLLLVLLSPIGCGSRFAWEGKWQGNRNLPVPAGKDKALYYTLGDVRLILESGNRFKMTMEGIPLTGSVRYEDEKAYLKIETRFNTSIEKEPAEVQKANKEMVLTSQKDGSLSFVDPGGYFPEPLTLKRKADDSSGF